MTTHGPTSLFSIRHADPNTSLEDPFKKACEVSNPYIEHEGSVENNRLAELDQA
jgi:hypothetical protein